MAKSPQERIAELEREVAALKTALSQYTAAVNGRKPLAALRNERGHYNLKDSSGRAPDGYSLINSPKGITAAEQCKVPYAEAVRYRRNGTTWETVWSGIIVPVENTGQVAQRAQELESKP